jgi:hypothetical protein
MSMLEDIRGVLPLEVGGGSAGVSFFNLHGPGEIPAWWLTVTSEYWWVIRGSETALSAAGQVEAFNAGRAEAQDEPSVAFLVGARITDVEGEDPEGGETVFVFDGGYRLVIHHDPEDEAFALNVPGVCFVGT